MRDRFPLLVLGLLALFGALGAFLLRAGARGSFADTLSTYRSGEDGARALYLLAEEAGLAVERRREDLLLLEEGVTPVLLAVEVEGAADADEDAARLAAPDGGLADEDVPRTGLNALRAVPLSEDERERLLERVRGGSSLVYAPWGSRENPLLDALGVSLDRVDPTEGPRPLVPAQPTPYARGVTRAEARVQAFLRLPERAAVVLEDAELRRPVVALVPYGAGRVLVVGAPELAMNRALGRADNAQLWLSALSALATPTRGRDAPARLAFDEHHHGFTLERSVVDFGRRYGLQFALAQLLAGLALWALALKRFGRPRPPPEAARLGGTDALFATSRLYREGRHHAFAAELLVRGLLLELAPAAGVRPGSTPLHVQEGLRARGRADLARGLAALVAEAGSATDDASLTRLASRAARLRVRLHPDRRAPAAPDAAPEEP